jgi:flagellar protein FlbD
MCGAFRAQGGAAVVLVHRLRGEPMFVNADLIESIEAAPDTVLTLVDGRRVFVDEPPDVVVERIVAFRASLLVAADEQRSASPSLSVVRDEEV